MNKPQLDVRMEYAESILRGLPKTAPTIAIDSVLGDYEAEDREEVLESIQAYADIRARQAIFVIYEAARATAEQRDSVIEQCAAVLDRRINGWRARASTILNGQTVADELEHHAHAIRALKSQQDGAIESKPAEQSAWQPIETAPKTGRTLLLGYPNSLGNWRTVRGEWMTQEYIEQNWEEPDDAEAGWYETSVEADDVPSCWPITPTHWQPLPAPPAGDGS